MFPFRVSASWPCLWQRVRTVVYVGMRVGMDVTLHLCIDVFAHTGAELSLPAV